jgi:hypothetical protein
MALTSTLQINGLEGLQRMSALLGQATIEKAQRSALSYAATAVPPAVAQGITAYYNLPSARVKKDISGVRFSSDGLSATIAFRRRPPTLSQFKPNPGRRGHQPGLGRGLGWGPAKPAGKPLTAAIVRGDRKPYRNTFIATGNSGNQLVFRRDAEGKLHSVYGPSIGSIFLGESAIGPDLRATVQARISEQYIKGFQRALDSASRGYGG